MFMMVFSRDISGKIRVIVLRSRCIYATYNALKVFIHFEYRGPFPQVYEVLSPEEGS